MFIIANNELLSVHPLDIGREDPRLWTTEDYDICEIVFRKMFKGRRNIFAPVTYLDNLNL